VSEPADELARIRELADFVVERFGPLSEIAFGFNRDSVAWAEGFIERQRAARDPSDGVPEGLVNCLGAFLGECIARATAGQWHRGEQDGSWSVELPNGSGAYPFAKVWKQFENGLEGGDSILGFYDIAMEYVAAGKLGSQEGAAGCLRCAATGAARARRASGGSASRRRAPGCPAASRPCPPPAVD
jgi:hypothetical protein